MFRPLTPPIVSCSLTSVRPCRSWTDSTNSHNHPALSADIGVYLYTLAGVQPGAWGYGEERRIAFRLDPKTAR